MEQQISFFHLRSLVFRPRNKSKPTHGGGEHNKRINRLWNGLNNRWKYTNCQQQAEEKSHGKTFSFGTFFFHFLSLLFFSFRIHNTHIYFFFQTVMQMRFIYDCLLPTSTMFMLEFLSLEPQFPPVQIDSNQTATKRWRCSREEEKFFFFFIWWTILLFYRLFFGHVQLSGSIDIPTSNMKISPFVIMSIYHWVYWFSILCCYCLPQMPRFTLPRLALLLLAMVRSTRRRRQKRRKEKCEH